MYLGEKEFAASPPLFDKRSGCYGNGLIETAEKPNNPKKVFDKAGIGIACYPKQLQKYVANIYGTYPFAYLFFDPALSLHNLSTKTR